ncbi:MAG TPA: hypothetical protein VHB97_22520 [Polyangia bacterium]|nr:hypothetical protein [Polyangia bacterium]
MLEAERAASRAVHASHRYRLLAAALIGLGFVVAASLKSCGH